MIMYAEFHLEKCNFFNQGCDFQKQKSANNNNNNNYQPFIKTSLAKFVINIINCMLVSI